MSDEEGPLTQPDPAPAARKHTLVWIRYKSGKHDHAAVVVRETDTKVRVRWDTTNKLQWLLKDDVTITDDSPLLDRRGRTKPSDQNVVVATKNNAPARKQPPKKSAKKHHPVASSSTQKKPSNAPVATITIVTQKNSGAPNNNSNNHKAGHAKHPPHDVSETAAAAENHPPRESTSRPSSEAQPPSDDDESEERDDIPVVVVGDTAKGGRVPKPKAHQPTRAQGEGDDPAVAENPKDKSRVRNNKNVAGDPSSQKASGKKKVATILLWSDSDSDQEEEDEVPNNSGHEEDRSVENGGTNNNNNHEEKTETPQRSNKRKWSRVRPDDTDDDNLEPTATGHNKGNSINRNKNVSAAPSTSLLWSDSDEEEEGPDPVSVEEIADTNGSTEGDSRGEDSDFEPTVSSNDVSETQETDPPAEEDDNDSYTTCRPPLEGEISVGDFVQRKLNGDWVHGEIMGIKRSFRTGRCSFIVNFQMELDEEEMQSCRQSDGSTLWTMN